MSEQPLPQPRSSMREALEKEDKEKAAAAAAAKEKAAVPKNGGGGNGKNGAGGNGKNGGTGNVGGGGNNGGGPPPGEETAREIQVVREAYRRETTPPAYVIPEEPPAMVELVGWYLYSFCSYFITHLLLPVLFPAIVTQVAFPNSDFTPEPKYTIKGATCSVHLMSMYQRLTRHSIVIDGSRLSPLGWSGLSWAIGILIVAPILTQTAHHLDRGQYQSLILIAATSFGSFFCLLTGFFKTVWVFLFYILFIAGSIIVAESVHTRNLGLMIRGLAAHDTGKHLVLRRRAAASQLSLYSTAIGGIGAALMAAFMYHMLRRTDQLTGLWVVSIFCGLIWFIGICHGLFTNRPSSSSPTNLFEPNFFNKLSYSMTLVRYPQAIGSLVAVFLSSFATMCIFTSGTLYAIGGVCIKYQRLTRHSIVIDGSRLSPLGWSGLSWAIGILIVAPILTQTAHHLDRGQYQSLILIAATSFGSFFCLLTGFFKTVWVFLFYILFIAGSIIVAESVHTRNLGLMIRGLAAHDTGKHLVLRRRAAASQLSLYSTAIGGIGAALMAAFMYHMLRRTDQLTGLWVVSIFCGLIWFIGICHGLFTNRPSSSSPTNLFEPNFFNKLSYSMTLVRYPQAIGSLVAVFLSSFATMCIFTSGTLYAIGGVCIKPVLVLTLWILYFLFPLISLPLVHPVQIIIRADAVRMQLLGFIICLFVSGAGFYFKNHRWRAAHIIVIALVQSTANGILYAFGRILLLDASPAGKEGAFSVWYAFVRSIGAMIGFAAASAGPGRTGGSFAAAFLGSFLGIIVLIFGNVSNISALKAAGHLKGMDDKGLGGLGEKGESQVADSGEGRGRV